MHSGGNHAILVGGIILLAVGIVTVIAVVRGVALVVPKKKSEVYHGY